jgi:drug/metabolite transporter superfamily protein YnfA
MLIETEKEDNRIWWFLVGTLTLSFIIGWFLNQNHKHEADTCREKGGIYVSTQYEKICLRKDSVIK